MKRTLRLASFAATLLVPTVAFADATPAQSLPYSQDWTDTGMITVNDSWTGVAGVVGLRGDGLVMATGVDPQTVIAESLVVDVNANQTSPNTFTTGGVTEFETSATVPSSSIALQGSGTADAPYVQFSVVTTGTPDVRVEYDLIDLDGSADNSIQPVALQFRVGTSGDFTNVPAAFVADASLGPSLSGNLNHINVVLPAAAGDQPVVQIRMITTDALGSDEWIAIDNVSIRSASTAPAAVGSSTPPAQDKGGTVQLTALVTPGSFPASTGLAVVCDLTAIGGSATAPLLDDGANGDGAAGDNLFGFSTTISLASTAGLKSLPCTVSDSQSRSSNFTIALTVNSVCSDGLVEGTEECDDTDLDPGDGCSATCTIESGYSCTGTAPSVCTDIDECDDDTDNCSADATCANTPGSFTCTCNPGFTGDGVTCTDIDECTAMTDDCDDDATCTNTPGDFTCACNPGYSGDGVTCTDIDECTAMTDNCSDNGSCTNTAGGFDCMCNAGFAGDGVTCTPVCGDDTIVAGETCDDGGAEADDGCSATCQVEPGWDCAGRPSVCTEDCGDGLVVGSEECDDAGNTDGDGCDATCVEEPGWMCTGEPSTCSEEALCGDGVVDAGEECDDGNEDSDDGCDATCTEETGWICNDAEPSECVADSDGDLIADDEDNCPDLANPSQADEDDDGVGDICDDTDPPSEDNGCCSTSRDSRSNMAGFALLALATLVCLRRRRRAA